MESAAAIVNLRERGKRERLRRIKEAAFEVFRLQGYDKANTREIARRADVSIGTLFVYAKDKHDLLCLVLNEDLDSILEESIAAVPGGGPAVDRIIALLRPIYEYFAREPELARAINREVAQFDRGAAGGGQAQRFHSRIGRWNGAVTSILLDAEKQGFLRVDGDGALLGLALFDLHLAEVRRWLLSEAPDSAAGLDHIAGIFRAVIGGRAIGPVSGAR